MFPLESYIEPLFAEIVSVKVCCDVAEICNDAPSINCKYTRRQISSKKIRKVLARKNRR